MKNIYSIGSYQVNAKDFKLEVFYTNSVSGTDINYLPVSPCQLKIVSKPLIQVLSFDKLNQQNDQTPDGAYDFIDGVKDTYAGLKGDAEEMGEKAKAKMNTLKHETNTLKNDVKNTMS